MNRRNWVGPNDVERLVALFVISFGGLVLLSAIFGI